MNLSQRWNHTDWTLSDPKNLQQGSKRRRVLEDACPPLFDSIYLQCLSWIVLVHLLDTFFFWLLTQHEVFDISWTSSFKPSQCKTISRAVFFEQVGHSATLSQMDWPGQCIKISKYDGCCKRMTNYIQIWKKCKTTMIKFNHGYIIIQYIQTYSNINSAHRLRSSSFNLESQASSDPRKQTRFRQTCWSENCICLWIQPQKTIPGSNCATVKEIYST